MSKEPEELRHEADEYLENIKLYASHWGKAALIAGGTIFITYKIVKGIAAKQRKIKEERRAAVQNKQYALASTKPSSRIMRMVKEQIALFLIAIAKQKLSEALKNRHLLNEGKAV